MKKFAMLLAASAFCICCQSAWCQSLDLSSLDKFAAKAKEANTVTLTHDQLQAAAHLVPQDDKDTKDGMKKVMSGLDSIQVRNYEFEEPGQFSDADLDGVRAQVSKMRGCTSIVESREKKEHSQVFLCTQDGTTTGLIVISSEPKELNVVYVKGNVNLNDLSKLHGVMGIPNVDMDSPRHDHPPRPPRPPRSDDKNDKDDQD